MKISVRKCKQGQHQILTHPRIINKAQKPLGMILQKEKRNICGQKCTRENQNMCLKRNIVHYVKTYIQDRILGRKGLKLKNTNQRFRKVYKHFIEKHKYSRIRIK